MTIFLMRPLLAAFLMATALAMPAMADNAASPEVAAWSPSDGDEIRFSVRRQGQNFGTHVVRFSEQDSKLVAETEVRLRAGLGPITVFRYDLSASEIWKDGRLAEIRGEVNDDGKRGRVRAERRGETLVVDGTRFTGDAPPGIVPASHWNYAQTRAEQLLSTEDGEILAVRVIPKGRETIRAGDRAIEANRYLMESDIDVDLWYDDDGRWVKLAFSARGQNIEYILDSLY